MKQSFVKWLAMAMALLMLMSFVVACGGATTPADTTGETAGDTNPADTDGTSSTEGTTLGGETAGDTEGDTTVETEGETEAVDNSNRINEPTDPAHVTFFDSKRPKLSAIFTGANQCNYEIVMDETYGSVLKLTTKPGASDPFISFNYSAYMKPLKLDAVSADEYKYVVLTVRVENCASETFELFYAAGNITGATAGYQTTASFDGSNTGWQKIIFDLSDKDFSGTVNMFRFDFFTTGSAKGGDAMYIYAVDFFKTRGEAYADLDVDMTRPGEGSDLTESKIDGVNYDKQNAPQEDANVDLWFDHITEKVYQNDTTSSGKNTYVISMAGNSIENCQFFLAPKATRNFRVELSAFSNGQNTLKTQVLYENYVNINGKMVPDALPPLTGNISVKGGNSQGFVIKVWADAGEQAGLYTATLNIYDADTGAHIKKANVYVNVWDFSLSEETALKTAIGLNDWNIVLSYQNKGMTDKEYWDLYKIYYDFLLENRLCAYRLPYSIGDSRAEAYLNNPRVTTFAINKSNQDVAGAYQILKNDPRWLEKGYFYYVDEPGDMNKLNELANKGNQLSSIYEGYNQVSPFFVNIQVDADTDQIAFMAPYTNIWCTKPFAFTPRNKYMIPGTQYMTTSAQDEKYGTFEERMKQQMAEGDQLWLYVCWEPGQPYANWLALGDGTEPIVSIWQCAMTGATGFLYWDSAYWANVNSTMSDLTPLIGATAHGDGVLLYSGADIGSYEPISSLRLEAVRLGIQDYQLLTMLQDAESQAKMDEMVAMVTTDVITYTNDDDYLHAVRVLLGEMVGDALKK